MALSAVSSGSSVASTRGSRWLRLLFLASIFFVSMASMEVVLECATRRLAGLEGSALGIVMTLGQFLGCCAVALLTKPAGATAEGGEGVVGFISKWLPYGALALLIFGSTGLANIAVSWVQFPVKVVFKSSKLVPVMLVATCMGNSRKYCCWEYLAAVLLCLGIAGFSFRSGLHGSTDAMVMLGVLLLTLSVFCDAFATNAQQCLLQRRGAQPHVMIFRQNAVAVVVCILLLALTGRLPASLSFCIEEPLLLAYLSGVGFTTGCGVWAYTQLLNEEGSVAAVGISTLRKLVTVLLSYAIFPKPLTYLQAFSCLVAAAGLVLASCLPGKSGTASAKPAAESPPAGSGHIGVHEKAEKGEEEAMAMVVGWPEVEKDNDIEDCLGRASNHDPIASDSAPFQQ
eukprot:NODE_9230_length_1438_cov_4.208238.p1 GENE.NODE_9230_length_1438_cov_4.208238~~NODE_9230_length_1438_cov_4.208238.p1  ORF type:complete len:411 (+),score=88.61 NODE_9230_length_1438_cov_4.208238:39-1235(+)